MKIIGKIFFFLLIIIVLVVVARNVVVKVAVERGVEAMTGLPLRMKKLDIDFDKTSIQIEELKILNPKNFPDRVMLDMPEIYVNYDFPGFLKKKVHLKEIRINLKEFLVVVNKEGEVNLNSLKSPQKKREPPVKKEEKKTPPPEQQIDTLVLKIGQVVLKDYSQGGEPSIQTFKININETFYNIKDVNSIVPIIKYKALKNAGIAAILGIDLGPLKDAVAGALKGAKDLATDTIKETTEILKQTTEDLKDIITEPLMIE